MTCGLEPSSRLALTFSQGGYRVPGAVRKEAPNKLQVSAFIMFAPVLLAKAKHIVKSRVSVGGDYPKLGYWEV